MPQQPSVGLPPFPGTRSALCHRARRGGSTQHQTSELPVFSLGCWSLSALQILCEKAKNKFIPPKMLLRKVKVS